MDNIKVTLESLYDILRNEKKREELQLLEDTFFIDVITYMRQKKAFLETKTENDDLFSSGERDKLDYEVRSIKRILKEIYEKREKKIIDIALNRSRTGSDIIDTSSMLTEEKMFYDKVLKTLDQFRRGILLNLFNGEFPTLIPEYKESEEKKEAFKKFEDSSAIVADSKELEVEDSDNDSEEESSDEDENEDEKEQKQLEESGESEESGKSEKSGESEESEKEEQPEQEKVKIKIIRPMPSFVWKDMKVYGPYDTGEEVEIFPEVADLMVRKGRAEKV
jgi:hypothetical protein